MPWWSWIVIWVALVALSLLYVVLLGIKLWRHFVALGREFSAASERLSPAAQDWDAAESSALSSSANQASAAKEPGWAVHADPAELKAAYLQGKQQRRADRRVRRIDRRAARGQAQSLSDLQHAGSEPTR